MLDVIDLIELLEFADSKKEIERYLTNRTDIIVEHILYLILAPESDCVSHWQTEIYSFISSVKKLSATNKYPTQKQIYDWTYEKIQDCVTDVSWMSVLIEDACDKENIENNFNVHDISKQLNYFCSQYFKWLSERLSSVGRVTRKDVISKLTSLM